MNDTKTEILRVRMTPMEKAALSRQANDQHKTMSEYIRSIAKCPPEVTRDEFEGSILQMIYEINKIGVNINQIAKKGHWNISKSNNRKMKTSGGMNWTPFLL